LPTLAGLVGAAVVVEAVLVLGGGSGKPAPAKTTSAALAKKSARPKAKATAPALLPPITLASAKSVLAGYTTTINTADASFRPAVLAAADGQGSYSIVASDYRQELAAKAKPVAAYGPQSAQFYIPLESAAYPHWFAVRVVNATTGRKPRSLGTQYLVFLRQDANASWREVDQPYVLGTSPDVAVSAAGYATAVSPAARGLAIEPDQMAGDTASSLDGHGAIADPGNLLDVSTAADWRRSLSRGTTVSLTHAATGDSVFALETAGGGALVFYTDSAQVTARPAKRKTLRLSVPGYYAGKQQLTSAALGYLDQFAAYDPPVTIPGLSIIADDSAIVS
jgi:hypothetical protein